MPILSNGKLTGLVRSRAHARCAAMAATLPADPGWRELAGLVDVIECRDPDDRDSWYYTGQTLEQLLLALPGWPEADRRLFNDWLHAGDVIDWIREIGSSIRNKPKLAQFEQVDAGGELYSPLQRAVERLSVFKAPAEHWPGVLNGLMRKGVSAQELCWSGVLDWLGILRGPVTRQDVLEFLREDPLELRIGREVRQLPYHRLVFEPCAEQLRDPQPLPSSDLGYAVVRYRNRAWNYRVVMLRAPGRPGRPVEWLALDAWGKRVADRHGREVFNTAKAARRAAGWDALWRFPLRPALRPLRRYPSETFAEGEDYREWLLTLPDYPVPYLSRHFRTLNMIAHARTKVRRVHGGDACFLFIEEIQSDWFQGEERHRDRGGASLVPGYEPDVPFRGEWVELVLKVLLLQAAREGLEGIAWTRGAHQEERYGDDCDSLHTVYDRRIPRFFERLAGQGAGRLDTVSFKTRRPWLYCHAREGAWGVFSADGRFKTRYRFTRMQAQQVQSRHCPVTAVAAPVFWLNESARATILEQGLPLFGMPRGEQWNARNVSTKSNSC